MTMVTSVSIMRTMPTMIRVMVMPPMPTLSPAEPTDTPLELTVKWVAVRAPVEPTERPPFAAISPDAVMETEEVMEPA